MRSSLLATSLLLLLLAGGGARAEDASDLAKKTQNPVADLISLPFQFNYGMDFARQDGVQNLLNIQPVWPFHVNQDWNLITRTILPLVSQPELTRSGRNAGFGDLTFTAFLSPASEGDLIWGVGPAISLPVASDDELGTGKVALGPSAVGLRMRGPWVYGALAQNLWSVAGDGGRDHVNRFLAQPFVNYNLSEGWYLVSAPIMTADWKADHGGDRWTVPLGGGFGRVFRMGRQPVNAQVQGFYNAAKPDIGPRWSARLQLQLLFPK